MPFLTAPHHVVVIIVAATAPSPLQKKRERTLQWKKREVIAKKKVCSGKLVLRALILKNAF